jgi:hypothetical protein
MNGNLNGVMGMAEGYNGITQGSTGAIKGGNKNASPTSLLPPSGGVTNALDPGTLMAIKAIVPALNLGNAAKAGSKARTGVTGGTVAAPSTATQGSQIKQLGQPQQASTPRSPGGPGVTNIGNNQNLALLIQHILGSIR